MGRIIRYALLGRVNKAPPSDLHAGNIVNEAVYVAESCPRMEKEKHQRRISCYLLEPLSLEFGSSLLLQTLWIRAQVQFTPCSSSSQSLVYF